MLIAFVFLGGIKAEKVKEELNHFFSDANSLSIVANGCYGRSTSS